MKIFDFPNSLLLLYYIIYSILYTVNSTSSIIEAKYFPYQSDFKDSPSQLFFEWQTDCSHIRSRPYEIEFKITDLPDFGPRLVDFSNWKITVVPSAPKGLKASLLPGRNVELNWDKYSCSNVEIIQIWRRIGSYDFDPEDCNVGCTGYELINENAGVDTQYIDTNSGKGLAPGSKYCYRLVAFIAYNYSI